MRTNKLSFNEARKIPITEYLTRLGFEPVSVRGNNHWYHSPFRGERTPSVKVDANRNVWYDHGEGTGGSIIDLGAKLHGCTPYEALEKLSGEAANPFSFHRPTKQNDPPENKVEVLAARRLTSPDLLQHLNSRGIDASTAQKYCKEIDFRIGKHTHAAVGLANGSGGYELRNRWFKGASSPKDVSLISNNSQRLCVLEGFMDFLSVHRLDHAEIRQLIHESDFLILNSVSFLNRSLAILKGYPEINLFLDNDLAASKAKGKLKENGIQFRDVSFLYSANKDVNEYLIRRIRNEQTENTPKRKPKGKGL